MKYCPQCATELVRIKTDSSWEAAVECVPCERVWETTFGDRMGGSSDVTTDTSKKRYEEKINYRRLKENQMKQNDAVVQAVRATLDQDIFTAQVVLDEKQREKVIGMVTEGIIAGKVDFSEEARARHNTPAKVKAYVGGMVSNHLRKDKRLNGGEKYIIKNPGSRPKKDPTIENLEILQQDYEKDSETWHKIEAAIYDRKMELAKSKVAVIDINALPEEFRHLVKKTPTTEE